MRTNTFTIFTNTWKQCTPCMIHTHESGSCQGANKHLLSNRLLFRLKWSPQIFPKGFRQPSTPLPQQCLMIVPEMPYMAHIRIPSHLLECPSQKWLIALLRGPHVVVVIVASAAAGIVALGTTLESCIRKYWWSAKSAGEPLCWRNSEVSDREKGRVGKRAAK